MIYICTYLTPKNEARDMSIEQIFSARINGNMCTDYQIIIKNNDTNETLYDSTKLHLSTPLYNLDILNHILSANIIANNLNLKWTLTVWENSNMATSGEAFFKSAGTATLVLTIPETINTQSYDFISTYTHPQNVPVKKFYYKLYDDSDNILQITDELYSANVHCVFDGFISNNSYKVESIVEDQNGTIVSSGKQNFVVSYSKPNINIIPNVELIPSLSATKITWGKAIQIDGEVTGTYAFSNEFNIGGNKALQLDSDSKLAYTIDIPEEFNLKFKIKFPIGFIGVFCSLGNDEYQIGYDGNYFYFNNKGTIIYSTAMSLPIDPTYIDIRPTDIWIGTTRIDINGTTFNSDISTDNIITVGEMPVGTFNVGEII